MMYHTAANPNTVTEACIGAVSAIALAVTALIAVADTMSTMDSCFMGTAKVTGVEIFGLLKYRKPLVIYKATTINVNIGRICIVVLAVGSTLFLLNQNQIALVCHETQSIYGQLACTSMSYVCTYMQVSCSLMFC
jgi:hypothetical protein